MNSERRVSSIERSHSPETDSHFSGKIHVICPRHGEPLVYGDTDAKLSWRGIWQVRRFTSRFTESLSHMPDNPKHVRVVWGDRPRTRQTGGIIHRQIADKIRKGHLPDVTLGVQNGAQGHEVPLFGPGATLGPLINSKIPKSKAFHEWRTGDEEFLHQLGAVTPDEFVTRFDRFFHKMGIVSDEIREKWGPEVFYIGVTSETTHGAILNKIYPELKEDRINIDYAEPFEMVINGSGQNPIFNFRGKSREYALYMPVYEGIDETLSMIQAPRPMLDNGA